jgi:hypothetical protein
MNFIGATVRYPLVGCKRTEQSTIVKTLRTNTGDTAIKLANGRILTTPPFIVVKFN